MKKIKIQHDLLLISFAKYDEENNLKIFSYNIENGKINLHSIDKYVKNGKNGKTLKKEEIYHFKYKNSIYNYETNEFEIPEIPREIRESVENYLRGFILNYI
jgi:hypothetical protein